MTNDKKTILGANGIPTGQAERKYRLGDLTVETNGTPAQIMQNARNDWHPSSFAVFVGTGIELDKRDQEIAGLKERLESACRFLSDAIGEIGGLRLIVQKLIKESGSVTLRREADKFKVVVEDPGPDLFDRSGATRIEVDPEEAERDYTERQRKVLAFFAKHPSATATAFAGAGITREVQFGTVPDKKPTLEELRSIERWLDQHGGIEWPG